MTDLIYWPRSQICCSCKYGMQVMREDVESFTYVCEKGEYPTGRGNCLSNECRSCGKHEDSCECEDDDV